VFQKITTEIINHCQICSENNDCLKNDCVVYRIKNYLHSVFNPSRINIDDFFEPEEKNQITLFDFFEDDEI
jgi:hypothetical protein